MDTISALGLVGKFDLGRERLKSRSSKKEGTQTAVWVPRAATCQF